VKTIKVLSTFIVAAALTLLAETTYHEYIQAYFKLILCPDYNYLMITLPITACIIIKLLSDNFEMSTLSIERISTVTMLLTTSLLISATAEIANDYRLQLKLLSYVLLSYSIIMLIFKPKTFTAGTLLFLSILTPIPLQPSPITPLTHHILTTCIALSLYSVHLTWKSKIPQLQKVAISLILAVTIVATAYMALEAATPHSQLVVNLTTPNNLLTLTLQGAVATLAYYLLTKYTFKKRGREKEHSMQTTARVWALLLIILAIIVAAYPVTTTYFTNEIMSCQVTPLHSLPLFITKFSGYLLENSSTHLYAGTLAPPLQNRVQQLPINITALHAGEHYAGYLEIADELADFSDWHAALIIQGHKIIKSWTVKSNNTINLILAEKNSKYLLVGYSLYSFKDAENQTKYARISVITYVESGKHKNKEANLLTMLSTAKQANIICENEASSTEVLSALTGATGAVAMMNTLFLFLIAATRVLSKNKSTAKRRTNKNE